MCLFPSGYTHALKIVIEILIFERSLKMKHQKKPNSNLDFLKIITTGHNEMHIAVYSDLVQHFGNLVVSLKILPVFYTPGRNIRKPAPGRH